MKLLQLSFKTSNGKIHHMNVKYASDNLAPEVVQKAMGEIAATKLFSKNGEDLVAEVLGAQYVDTIQTPLFGKTKI